MSSQIDKIMQQLSKPEIKCVSFDMFDTLVQRPVLEPKDIFCLVGNMIGESPFFEKRRTAAQERAMLFKDYYTAYVTLDDIYKHYQIMFGTSDEETQRIKQTELAVERKLIFPRKCVQKIYNYALTKGKKVVVTTDMYLSSVFLEEILKDNGYQKWYKVYVSCEENATKRSGELYKKLITDLHDEGIYEKNILHIGDNLKSDIEAAKSQGIKAVHIPSAASCFKECARLTSVDKWKSAVYPSSQTLMLGLYACIAFDDPFVGFDKNSRYNGNATLLGEFLAPFLISFCLWFVNELKKDGIDRLVLVWRDGFIPEKIIELLRPYIKTEIPVVEKIYLNRALRHAFVANKKGGFFDSMYQWCLNPKMNIEEFAQSIMNCHSEEEKRAVYAVFAENGYTSIYQEIGSVEKYNWFIHELEPLFLKMYESTRDAVWEKISDLKDAKKLGIFDIGYRGTVSRFLAENFDMQSTTYHMLGTMGIDDEVDGVVLKSYVKYSQNIVQNTKNTLHKFMELIISEQIPSILRYENENLKVQEVRDPFFEADNSVIEIQNGIMTYTKMFAELFGEYMSYLDIDRNVLFTMVTAILSSPNEKDAGLIKKLPVTAEHYVNTMTTFESWYNSFFEKKEFPKKSSEI